MFMWQGSVYKEMKDNPGEGIDIEVNYPQPKGSGLPLNGSPD